MRGFLMGTGVLLMIVTILGLFIVPPLVLLIATFAWRGRWIARAWVPVPVFALGLWLSQTIGSTTPDLDGGEMWGIVIIGGAAVVYYAVLFRLGYREQRAKLLAGPSTPAQ